MDPPPIETQSRLLLLPLPSFRLLSRRQEGPLTFRHDFKWPQKLPILDPRYLLYGVCAVKGTSPCRGVPSE